MKITILGSGGFTPTPLTNCHCELCERARINPKMARTGPSLYIHDLDFIIDLSIEAHSQIDNLGLFPKNVSFSHWHPDHTEGWRILELFDNQPKIYIQENSTILDRVPGLGFLANQNKIKINSWEKGAPIIDNDFQLTYFILNKDIPVYAFKLTDSKGKVALIVPDHSKFLLDLPIDLSPDLLIMNLGVQTTTRNITTFDNNLEIINKFRPKKVILTHIEASYDLSPSQIKDLEINYNSFIAHDNQVIEI